MIDLHTHTTYSDGTDSVKELLEKAEKAKLEILSITDHNAVDAYIEMEEFDWVNYFQGDIVVGCEFTCCYKGRMIEVLGYDFDYQHIKKFLDKYYNRDAINERTRTLYFRFMEKIKELGIIGDFVDRSSDFFETEFFEFDIYSEIVKHKRNWEILDEELLSNYSNFYRLGLTNPKSNICLNYGDVYPDVSEVLNIIHESNGKAFLAHPYQYKFKDTEWFIIDLYNNYKLDGIEALYTTFTASQMLFLVRFAKSKGLLVSGGSDYHGLHKQGHELGGGRGNLVISRQLMSDWDISYYIE